MATVHWVKSSRGAWCELERLDLKSVKGAGVYVIWAGKTWLYVGQGDIASRLQAHRGEDAIMEWRKEGALMVTWAIVPDSQLDGLERYLADALRPTVGKQHPNTLPIPVNLPS